MRIYIYRGGEKLVGKSGVGQAMQHQRESLHRAGISPADHWAQDVGAIHVNTVLPDSVAAALGAKLRGKKVVWYGHSTMEDFRDSFKGSNLLAPLFRRWITFCYGLGDVVITPTEYSRDLLKTYGLRRPVYPLSNGVDTAFFHPDKALGAAFRRRYGLGDGEKAVISVGHTIARKGLPEFLEMARRMPAAQFFWFGWTDPRLVPAAIREAMDQAPANVRFPGFVDRGQLREAYCGADVFAFLSHEETEGIVVLEALSCGIPTVVRDIPVYQDWLEDGKNVYKAADTDGFCRLVEGLLDGALPDLTAAGEQVAAERSLEAVGRQLREIYRQERILPPLPAPLSPRRVNV
ncbi:glycosyltransferase family 4 protein [Oscillibacter sp.]|uniref:glycosyltransferase family 4 protein n=1 Tax=Oscillibacter sp. TaxID=1945593 RepID=UPI00262F3946|nr:glycosyltransferase family 4 protein [Oscillibacter sp.]MDD3347247.1 glycosyltransferase family 4 protein [Oscillibacter sp.]